MNAKFSHNGSNSKIVAYAYYNSPWRLELGDTVRIHKVLSSLAKIRTGIVAFTLNATNNNHSVTLADGIIYVTIPRKIYRGLSKLIKWSNHYDLNPLIKLTHFIDEFIIAVKLYEKFKKASMIVIFGSMTLLPFILRLLRIRKIILYDPLANFVQSLYLKSRRSYLELIKYGLYLILHKLVLRSSDIVAYPTKIDLENAKKMFKPKKTVVVPNPSPICYESIEEFLRLRSRRLYFDKPYFVFFAGSRGNLKAVRMIVEIFNKIEPSKFKLIITGPWQDIKGYFSNPSIELPGLVSKEKLKELAAIADYGLALIFDHCAGTPIKTLTYISAGLDLIATPCSLLGLDIPHGIRVYLIKDVKNLAKIIKKLVDEYVTIRRDDNKEPRRPIILCRNSYTNLDELLEAIQSTTIP